MDAKKTKSAKAYATRNKANSSRVVHEALNRSRTVSQKITLYSPKIEQIGEKLVISARHYSIHNKKHEALLLCPKTIAKPYDRSLAVEVKLLERELRDMIKRESKTRKSLADAYEGEDNPKEGEENTISCYKERIAEINLQNKNKTLPELEREGFIARKPSPLPQTPEYDELVELSKAL